MNFTEPDEDGMSGGELERNAQFWIEGILTPMVGVAGVTGQYCTLLSSESPSQVQSLKSKVLYFANSIDIAFIDSSLVLVVLMQCHVFKSNVMLYLRRFETV